ncbi:hypothetical protein [Micromonospora peucetia]|uniref:Uncharacterized protein n=1 Tax=Micromonospora peucetia TaxID=47871 RepID=A0ABZ1EJW8_9ACTN|nr:hypothetical protein [Micromonospora peucetia]WSA34531.1 hypothetical protein OIE14_11055 [Micromonospora peucetia]
MTADLGPATTPRPVESPETAMTVTHRQHADDSIEAALARFDNALAQSKAHLDAFHADLRAIEARDVSPAALAEPVPAREHTDRIPLTRPVPTLAAARAAGIFAPAPAAAVPACGHTPDQHQALNGLEADLRTARRDATEWQRAHGEVVALASAYEHQAQHAEQERDQARQLNNQLADVIGQKQDEINAHAADVEALVKQRDEARRIADSLRQDLSDAGDVIAAIREAAERLDDVIAAGALPLPDIRAAVEHIAQALAAYDTVNGEAAPEPTWGESQVIAGLRTGAAHPTLQKGAANLIERLIRQRDQQPPRPGSPSPRAQDEREG